MSSQSSNLMRAATAPIHGSCSSSAAATKQPARRSSPPSASLAFEFIVLRADRVGRGPAHDRTRRSLYMGRTRRRIRQRAGGCRAADPR